MSSRSISCALQRPRMRPMALAFWVTEFSHGLVSHPCQLRVSAQWPLAPSVRLVAGGPRSPAGPHPHPGHSSRRSTAAAVSTDWLLCPRRPSAHVTLPHPALSRPDSDVTARGASLSYVVPAPMGHVLAGHSWRTAVRRTSYHTSYHTRTPSVHRCFEDAPAPPRGCPGAGPTLCPGQRGDRHAAGMTGCRSPARRPVARWGGDDHTLPAPVLRPHPCRPCCGEARVLGIPPAGTRIR